MIFNFFRIAADLCHLLSFIVLILKLKKSRSAYGISLKTQLLYMIVFMCRYLDLIKVVLHPSRLFTFLTLYNTTMKILYILLTAYIVFLMTSVQPYKSTYDKTLDTFRILEFAIIPCATLALFVRRHTDSFFFDYTWTFSIYLEAICIMPQLMVLQRYREIENLTSNYVFLLGAYRLLYILNWVVRYATESNYSNWIVWISGVVQTGLYIDFFYYYALSKWFGRKMTLPS
ncbi:hypothetical protein WA158_000614 [Blastocystis sp. Blastoise]